jgi:hypothetical protein
MFVLRGSAEGSASGALLQDLRRASATVAAYVHSFSEAVLAVEEGLEQNNKAGGAAGSAEEAAAWGAEKVQGKGGLAEVSGMSKDRLVEGGWMAVERAPAPPDPEPCIQTCVHYWLHYFFVAYECDLNHDGRKSQVRGRYSLR